MRRALAFLAVIALLLGPVTTAFAQGACSHDGAAMAGMDMPTTPMSADAANSGTKADPCCNHAGKHHSPAQKSCIQGCAAACAVTVALPVAFGSSHLTYAFAPFGVARTISARGHDPGGLERPPKSIA